MINIFKTSINRICKVLLAAVIITFSWNTYSQKNVVTFLDRAWLLTSKDFAKYFRIGIIDNKYKYYGEVKDFYISGKLQMKGKFVANIKMDTFYFYYPSGNIMTKGFYQNNSRYGIWYNYYDNGKLKEKLAFNEDFICALEYYDVNGNPKIINGTGKWETEYYEDFTTSLINVSGSYKDTLRHGVWFYYNTSLIPDIEGISNVKRLECIEEYDCGRFIKGKYYWGGGSIQNISVPTMKIFPERKKFEQLDNWNYSKFASIECYPFLKFLPKADSSVFPVDKKAQFPGGLDSLSKVFIKNMKFSKSYISSQEKRSCMFTIMVNEVGKIKIIDDANKLALMAYPGNQIFYQKALKTIKTLQLWEPAKRGMKTVKNYFLMSIYMDNGKVNVLLISIN